MNMNHEEATKRREKIQQLMRGADDGLPMTRKAATAIVDGAISTDLKPVQHE
jgi:hypothetical protein